MREVKTHTINGVDYRIQPVGAKAGRNTLVRIFKALAPAADASDEEIVSKLAANLSEGDFDYLCDLFAKATRFCPSPGIELPLADHFDDHFAGHYGSMMKWLWAALETNYGNFLGELGLQGPGLDALVTRLTGIIPSAPKAPTGPSGASSQKAGGAS